MTSIESPITHEQIERGAGRGRLQAAALLVIIALAAYLRIRGISVESLWGDEALSWLIARMSLKDLIQHVIWWEQIPPAHHLLLWAWMRIVGDSELALRLPSALAGVGCVIAIYFLVRRLIDARTALAASLIIAVAPLHIAYGQEARTYQLTLLVAIVSTDLFVRLIRQPTHRLQVAYVVVSGLLLYCHIYGAFVLAAHQLAFFASLYSANKPDLTLRRWIELDVAIAALFSPWVPIVIRWVRAVNVNFWVKKVTWDDISRGYWVFSGSTPLYLILIALVVLGVARLRRERREALPLLLSLLLLPVIVPVAVSVFGRPSFAPRYAMVACIGMYPLAAAGLAALPTAVLRGALMLAIAILGVAAIGDEATVIPKSPWREVVAYVESHARPVDIAVVHIKAKTRMYDYYRRTELQRRGFDTGSLPLSPPLENGRHVWFVRHEEWAPLHEQLSRGGWHTVSHKWFGDVLVLQLTDEAGAAGSTTRPD